MVAPLTIDTFQNLSLPVATTVADGYLSAADWALFNGKQNFLTAGANITIATVGSVTTISSTGGGGGGSFTPLPNGGIDIDVSINPNVISTIYNTAIGGSVTSTPVGGAPALPANEINVGSAKPSPPRIGCVKPNSRACFVINPASL